MNGCELALSVTALATVLASQIEDDGDLNVLATMFTQFGDSLATIVAWRARSAAIAAKEKAETAQTEAAEPADAAEPTASV